MSTQTAVYTKITEKDATEITSIMGQTTSTSIVKQNKEVQMSKPN